MRDTLKDIPPCRVKTIKRTLSTMIDLFFQESHENIRNACFISFSEILDHCFVDKKYGKEGKPAAELMF